MCLLSTDCDYPKANFEHTWRHFTLCLNSKTKGFLWFTFFFHYSLLTCFTCLTKNSLTGLRCFKTKTCLCSVVLFSWLSEEKILTVHHFLLQMDQAASYNATIPSCIRTPHRKCCDWLTDLLGSTTSLGIQCNTFLHRTPCVVVCVGLYFTQMSSRGELVFFNSLQAWYSFQISLVLSLSLKLKNM